MERVQRQLGKTSTKTADESQVGQLIKDFHHATDLLGVLIKSTKAWQQSWIDILDSQERLTACFLNAANPILTSSQDSYNGPPPVETPPQVSRKMHRLHHECQALREELDPDIQALSLHVIGPATQAKDSMHSMKLTIKTRDDCKLDFEKWQGRRDAAFRKDNRTERDNAMLAKHESEVQTSQEVYERVDHALRSSLPGLLDAVYSLIPQLLQALIRASHNFIANYYTTVHEFCEVEKFQMPPPGIQDIITAWAEACKPAQSGIESLSSCANIKRGRLGAAAPRLASGTHSTASISPRPSPRPSYSHDDVSPSNSQERVQRIPSGHTSQVLRSPGLRPPPSPNPADFLSSTVAASKPDYLNRDRNPSISSAVSAGSSASIAGVKKRPPPVPPKKPMSKPETWVTALYDFAGQNPGDLQMKEGDKIKVIKKTDSTNDWWEGECNGMRGSFPANYCKV